MLVRRPIPDLFASDPANACGLYKKVRAPENEQAQNVRDYMERLWTIYYRYADPQFVAEFPLHVHQRWYEMYLTVTLLELGAQVQTTAPPGPDVLVNASAQCVWIEAVCGTGGAAGQPDSVEEPPVGYGFNVPWDKIALRIRGSVEEKRIKFDGYLQQQVVKSADWLLIAINVHQIPYAPADFERYIFRALYGVGAQVLTIDRRTMKAVDSSNEQIFAIPKTKTGQPVGTMPFIDGSMPAIAGIIVSAYGAVAHANQYAPDLTLYPNLTAARAWPTGMLPIPREWTFSQSQEGWSGKVIIH